MADRVWKGFLSKVIGHSGRLLQNKFLVQSTPSMRKGRDRGEKRENWGERYKKNKIMTFLVATNVVASRPSERRPTVTLTARANCSAADHTHKPS